MKKILYYCPTFPVFSEGFITREIEAVSKFGDLDVRVLSLARGAKSTLPQSLEQKVTYVSLNRTQKLLNTAKVIKLGLTKPVVLIKFLLTYKGRSLSLGTAVSLLEEVVNFSPDLIFANWLTEGALMANMLSDLSGIPFAIECHATDIWLSSAKTKIDRVKAAKFVVTCTKFNKDFLERVVGKRLSEKIHLIYHYLDPNIFQGKVTTFNDEPVIYLVGRKVEKKGFAYMIKAASILFSKGLKFKVKIAGDTGPEDAKLKKMVQELGLEGVVGFTQEVTFEQHCHNFYESDVYVIPSVRSKEGDLDGIPYTLVEAAMAGLPLVATSVSAIPELIEDTVNGFLVKERDEVSLAGRLEELILDKSLRKRMGEAARARVLSMFSFENTVYKLRELFVSV